jgi:hypothetical protein
MLASRRVSTQTKTPNGVVNFIGAPRYANPLFVIKARKGSKFRPKQ